MQTELELTEVALLYLVVWSPGDVADRETAPTYVVIYRNVVQDIACKTLTCDFGVGRVHVYILGVCETEDAERLCICHSFSVV